MEEESGKIWPRLKHAWNAFVNQDEDKRIHSYGEQYGVASRPDRVRLFVSNERSLISSIYTRLSIDVAANVIAHVRLDENGQYEDDIKSNLNNCLTVEANLDQPARMFRQDLAMSMFDRGVIAIVPVDTTLNPELTGGYDILNMRIGTIVSWFPKDVRVRLYNQDTGRHEEITLPKSVVAIVENPFYAVMNEPNSTLQRVIRKLNLLDAIDEQSGSGRLDIIIQLPYTLKSEAKREQAEQRRKEIEFQLKGSQYGIAYSDATEKITQLNRPAENNLMNQIEYLFKMLYGQLGLTEEVMNGTADEAAMINYMNRTIEPILTAITEAMRSKFLTKTARTQGQSIMYFINPFKLIPMSAIAEIADKFTRNEIMTSNDFRRILGLKPSKDPKADQLRNSNMPESELGNEKPALKVVPKIPAQTETVSAVESKQ